MAEDAEGSSHPMITVGIVVSLGLGVPIAMIVYIQTTPEVQQVFTSGLKPRKFSLLEVFERLDSTIDPCVDFYRFACGGWINLKSRTLAANMKNLFSDIEEQTYKGTISAIRTSTGTLYGKKSTAVLKMKTWLKSCSNNKGISAAGITPVMRMIDDLGSWTLTNYKVKAWREKEWTLQTTLENVKDACNGLFCATVETLTKTHKQILTVSPARLTGKKADFSDINFLMKFTIYSTEVVTLLGGNYYYAVNYLMKMYWFEEKLAQAQPAIATSQIMKISEFHKLIGNLFDLKRILLSVYSREFSANEPVSVVSGRYFQQLKHILKKTSKATLANYLVSYQIRSFMSIFRKIRNDAIYNSEQPNSGDLSNLTEACMSLTLSMFGPLARALYIEKFFPAQSGIAATSVAQAIIQNILSSVDRLQWLDSQSKQQLKRKTAAMKLTIGTSTWLMSPESVDEKYEKLTITDNFFDNVRSLKQFMNMESIEKLDKSPDSDWSKTMAVPNAVQYVGGDNNLIITAAALQPPIFGHDYPSSYVFGTIGTLIAHELAQFLIASGKNYDTDGKLTSGLWTETTNKAFRQSAQCYIEQDSVYNNVRSQRLGNFTWFGNIIDAFSVKIALDAQRATAKNGPVTNPNVELSADHLFFLGYAQTMCTVGQEHLINSKYREPEDRLKLTLGNSKDFSQVYQCPAHSPMNTIPKCQIWG